MINEWTSEGSIQNELQFGRYRQVWQAIGEEMAYGGEFSIIQTEKAPDRLAIQCKSEYGQELSRKEVERLIRNLQTWLDHGDETKPGTCAKSGDIDEEELENGFREAVRISAEECGVEKVVFQEIRYCDGTICWNFYVLWGREIAYTDMMRFIDGCGQAPDYVNFYCAEFSNELDRFNGSDEIVYVRRGSDRRPSGAAHLFSIRLFIGVVVVSVRNPCVRPAGRPPSRSRRTHPPNR